MKVLAFSDLHRAAPAARRLVEMSRNADLVIAAGDFTNHRLDLEGAMALLDGLKGPVVMVPGNNESEDELRGAAPENAVVLHGETTEVAGLKLFGIGYAIPVTPFKDWSCDLTEAQGAELLSGCEDVDVLITHSPPKGVVDKTSQGVSLGSTAVLQAIERIQPPLVVCGHIHDCWGRSAMVGESHVANLGPAGTWFEVEPKG
ncbi:Icc-related predicted phosphoesterase [Shimia isoporae]|uniref:Icc-related predicted phosphoesterase n=1 Tax=Shimia isoporae TaxID=647720 RepID=A0A4R1N297_9RHOB|nr:metallophosphoesterase [Shimia isoporae]TCK99329.1 Icc-related predicted phosphoesterase [Shimia isoporae]